MRCLLLVELIMLGKLLATKLATKLATNETETCCHTMVQSGILQESLEANMA